MITKKKFGIKILIYKTQSEHKNDSSLRVKVKNIIMRKKKGYDQVEMVKDRAKSTIF